jgi:hypothetical protein
LVGVAGVSGSYRADTCLWRVVLRSGGGVPWIQSFEAFLSGDGFRFYRRFYHNSDFNYFIINILILTVMTQVNLLFANKTYDTAKQAVAKNQIIQMNGYEDDRYVVYGIRQTKWGLSYELINLRTHEFGQCDLIRPLSEKFGIGYYYDDANPQFMDTFEVAILRGEAEQIADEKRKEQQEEQECSEQLQAIGKERLQTLIPENAKAVIIAELHEDDSDPMTDYYSYNTRRTVILGFSNHTKDLFSEMHKYASNFEETTHLAEVNEAYEHREKYAGGSGYFLGESKYSGWIVRKEKYYKNRESMINGFALVAGNEANICVKVQEAANAIPEAVTGDFTVVDYSEKAIAVFGDTRPLKDQLKALGGRFNPKLTHEGGKRAGWIFSKSKEQELMNLLTIK